MTTQRLVVGVGGGTYEAVISAMYELGQFEDLLQAVPLQAQPPQAQGRLLAHRAPPLGARASTTPAR